MNLLQMSMTAGILIVGIVLLRVFFIHRMPKKAMILLWEIAILRLVLPVSVPMPFPGLGDLAAITVSGTRTENLETTVVDALPWVTGWEEAQGAPMAEESAQEDAGWIQVSVVMDETADQNTAVSVTEGRAGSNYILWLIYGAVALVMAAGSWYLYFRDSQLFREGLPMSERERFLLLRVLEEEWDGSGRGGAWRDLARMKKADFRISDRTLSPVTCGVFRPAIVFPKGIWQRSEKEIAFWLRHELVHIRHRDNLKKLIAHGVLCLHWFNPLVWLLYVLFNRDMELACDEDVVSGRGENRRDYALALLSMAEQRSMGFQTGMGFGKNAVTERITAVMKFRKMGAAGILGTVLAVMLSLTVFGSHYVSYAAASSDVAAYEVSADQIQAAEYVVTMGVNLSGDDSAQYGVNFAWEETDKGARQEAVEGTASRETPSFWTADAEASVMAPDATLEATTVVEESAMSAADSAAEGTAESTVGIAAAHAGESTVDGEELAEDTGNSIENIVQEYRDYGLSAEISGADYQLYYEGEPVYFFADNRVAEEEGFSGRLLLRTASRKNGMTGVVTRYDEKGELTGLAHLSQEESRRYTRRWQ